MAERFLGHLAPQVLAAPDFTPLADIMTALHSKGYLTFDFNTPLGYSPQGHKYLGRYQPTLKRISIDRNLSDQDPRYTFTIAHELGHFYLHSKIRPEAFGIRPEDGILDSARDLAVHRIQSTQLRSVIEWQANRFAAGILVPRRTLPLAVVKVQTEVGITHNLGKVWFDPQRPNDRDYRDTVANLAALYQVSRSVIRFRLGELGIAHEFSATGQPTRVSTLVGPTLRDLFEN